MRMTEIIGTPKAYNISSLQQREEVQVKEVLVKQAQEKAEDSRGKDFQESSPLQKFQESGEKTREDMNPKEVSLTFNKEESFDYIGSESSLANLDVQKAISVMKKDKILQEYQYFVGGKPDLEYDGDIDGSVFPK